MPEAATKMVGVDIDETSGVDLPAHLTPGWVVLKNAGTAASLDTEETPVTDTVTKKADADAPCAACGAVAKSADAETSIEVLKAAMPEPLRAYLETVEKAATDAAAREAEALEKAAEQENARLDSEAIAKAAPFKDLGLEPEAFGPILRKFAGLSPEGAEAIEKALTAALNRGEAQTLFDEVGKVAKSADGASAEDQIESLAKAAVAEGHAPNLAKARVLVAEANPDLYLAYTNEMKG